MVFDTIHGGLGKKWREWKTEIEKFSNFCIKIKNFVIRKDYRCIIWGDFV